MNDEVRPIDANALIKAVRHCGAEWNLAMAAAEGRQISKCFKMQELCRFVEEYVKIMPTMDYAPVEHAKWVRYGREYRNGDVMVIYRCSVCGRRAEKRTIGEDSCISALFPYCHCGAKMDEATP